MRVGFSGTRIGLTEAQRLTLSRLLHDLQPTEFHHGDCIGADAEAHSLVRLASPRVRRVIHPPLATLYRAYCEGEETWPAKDYLDRNDDIVAATEVLIACPAESVEQSRSGTWATVRRARREGKRVILVFPDGGTEEEQP